MYDFLFGEFGKSARLQNHLQWDIVRAGKGVYVIENIGRGERI